MSPLSIMRHAYGVVVDVIQPGRPGRVEEEKVIMHAVFMPVSDGEVKRPDRRAERVLQYR